MPGFPRTLTTFYTYDNAGRLTAWNVVDASSTPQRGVSLTLDDVGNRLIGTRTGRVVQCGSTALEWDSRGRRTGGHAAAKKCG